MSTRRSFVWSVVSLSFITCAQAAAVQTSTDDVAPGRRTGPTARDRAHKFLADGKLLGKAHDLTRAGRLPEARAIYDRLLAENRGLSGGAAANVSAAAVAGLASVALKSGDNAAALRHYRELMAVSPGENGISDYAADPGIRMKYALLLRDAGFHDEAWVYYRLAAADDYWMRLFPLSLSPQPRPPALRREQVPTPMFTYVVALSAACQMSRSYDPELVVSYARTAVKANPTGGLGHFYLGRILMKTEGGEAEARAEFEKAIRYGGKKEKALAARSLTEIPVRKLPQ